MPHFCGAQLGSPNPKQVQTDSRKHGEIGSYVRRENTLILHKNTLVFLKFDESMRRMRVQDTYFYLYFKENIRKLK